MNIRTLLGAEGARESAFFTRYNFHREASVRALSDFLANPAGPRILLLSGESGSGRKYLLESAIRRMRAEGHTIDLILEIDLDGFDHGRDLAKYLRFRLIPAADESQEAQEAAGKILSLAQETLLSGTAFGILVSLARGLIQPLKSLHDFLKTLPPARQGVGLTDAEIVGNFLDAQDGETVLHLVDAHQFPKLLQGQSPWHWLPNLVMRAGSKARLVISCRPDELELDVLPPLHADHAEQINVRRLQLDDIRRLLDSRFARHQFPKDLAQALLDYSEKRTGTTGGLPGFLGQAMLNLVESGGVFQDAALTWQLDEAKATHALGQSLFDPISQWLGLLDAEQRAQMSLFLVDAALCRRYVPAQLLLEAQRLDEDQADALHDLIDEVLIEEVKLFEDHEALHPGFPGTIIYSFRDPLLPAILLKQLAFSLRGRDLRTRAAFLVHFLESRLAGETRDIAHLELALADHLKPEERAAIERKLAWWVGMEEAELLKNELAEQLRRKEIKAEVIWSVATSDQETMPPYRQLAILEAYEKGYGVDDERLLTFVHWKSRLLSSLGRFPEALVNASLAYQLSLTSNGSGHLATLTVQHNLARALQDQGDLVTAREHFEAVLEARNRLLGSDHLRSLTTRNNLASVLKSEGDLDSARVHFEAVLEATNRLFGPGHPDTLTTRHNLATVLKTQGDLDSAREQFEAVLEARNRLLGPEHPSTLATRHSLAHVLQDQGEFAAAREHFKVVLEAENRVLGREHPSTMKTTKCLAALLKDAPRSGE